MSGFALSSLISRQPPLFRAGLSARQASSATNDLATGKNATPAGHVVGRSGKVYSPTTVKMVEMVGKLLGYNLRKSNAVTLTSAYYDRCAARFEVEKEFWLKECGLPDSFQTWFQITQLHMWLLTVRFRAMPPPLGKMYTQEFVNHAFLDTEHRIRGPQYKVTKGTLVKKYMQIMLHQHRGAQTGMDWAIAREADADQMLAAAIWRNIFGAAWGKGMGGVKGVFSLQEDIQTDSTIDLLLTPASPDDEQAQHTFEGDVKFAEILERLVTYVRKELVRLDQVSDKTIVSDHSADQGGITQFGKI